MSAEMKEPPETVGLLTEEILGRAANELRALGKELLTPSPDHDGVWLAKCDRRLDNALRDVLVTRERFRKAQT